MKNYIGLACTAHDPAIAVVDEHGEVLFAEGTERALQVKRAWFNPADDIHYVDDILRQHCDPDADLVVATSWRQGAPLWVARQVWRWVKRYRAVGRPRSLGYYASDVFIGGQGPFQGC